MHVDWQNIAVLLVVLAALVYVGRRGLSRVRSLVGRGQAGAPSCASGCGTCGDAQPAQQPRVAAKPLVQLTRTQNRSPRS
jgi:hypothetical protein